MNLGVDIPTPLRAANGYRLYTKVHLAYFRCIRGMFPGFGVTTTCNVLQHIQNADMDNALWLVNKEQAILHHEKAEKSHDHWRSLYSNRCTSFSNSTLGKRRTARDPENGYRIFTPMHIRQILLLCTLRRTVNFLENMKEIVQAVEHQNIKKAKKVTEMALLSIHERNRQQLFGVQQLIELCKSCRVNNIGRICLILPTVKSRILLLKNAALIAILLFRKSDFSFLQYLDCNYFISVFQVFHLIC